MATAKVETVTKTVSREVEEKVVNLQLTEDEAKVLRALTGFVTGSAVTTYYKEIDAIKRALIAAGYPTLWLSDYFTGRLTASRSYNL